MSRIVKLGAGAALVFGLAAFDAAQANPLRAGTQSGASATQSARTSAVRIKAAAKRVAFVEDLRTMVVIGN